MTDFVVITGMSGAGRSTAAGVLEDRGWFVIDNLPTSLMGKVAELATAPGSTISQVALAIGPGAMFEEPSRLLEPLRAGEGSLRVVFLDATTDALVQRYEGTKRRHPIGGDTLATSIERERTMADGLRAQADLVIDTSDLSVHDLRARIEELVETGTPDGLNLSLTSFGYKHGLPRDADIVLDVRFLPNPHWVEELRPRTGRDPEVRDHAFDHPSAGPFLDQVTSLLELLLPEYEREGKAYLSIAFGCTGGHHRSVAVVEEVAARLRDAGSAVTVSHRDIAT
ncbi:RNase adapter RapZ [Iamia majanohamensis]|uniref:RNase adapter RapZ n=1 Tax=Iamia majanohamensis TaxID=467976 RepID=A0AAE9Y9J1_9ACTN|nr:RNase adapter RapZ [Iamia majanohamensis]WCO69087.1 RNase adapter RapZ [Iamia majanohamensis]